MATDNYIRIRVLSQSGKELVNGGVPVPNREMEFSESAMPFVYNLFVGEGAFQYWKPEPKPEEDVSVDQSIQDEWKALADNIQKDPFEVEAEPLDNDEIEETESLDHASEDQKMSLARMIWAFIHKLIFRSDNAEKLVVEIPGRDPLVFDINKIQKSIDKEKNIYVKAEMQDALDKLQGKENKMTTDTIKEPLLGQYQPGDAVRTLNNVIETYQKEEMARNPQVKQLDKALEEATETEESSPKPSQGK